jgi:hypothetical protein
MSETKETTSAEPTPEEIKQMYAKMDAFRKEQIPLLKRQLEYEQLLADIEEARTKRIHMTLKQGEMLTPPSPPEVSVKHPVPPSPERKLKKE